VAQIFRTWKDPDGQIWINACWYYRPEQTVHWVEKRFYQDEVVKTGQYRDHSIDEVIGKCFVMFFTRYSRGRPKGVDENKIPIYVCESRYNETEKHFNRIKTWKSCVPDAVRGEDYEVDLFEKQRVLKKVPSPIAHLLPPNAKEGDTLPDAKMGVENAPPVVGAVFKRARREAVCCPFLFAVVCFFSSFAMADHKPLQDSPPPEPTPPPPPPMPIPVPQQTASSRSSNRRTSDYHETMSMTEMYKQAHQAASVAAPPPPPTPHQTPQTPNMSGMHHQQQLRNPIQHYTPGAGGGPYPSHPPPMLQRHPSSGGSLQSPMIPPYSPAQHHSGMHPQQQPQQTPQQYGPAQPPKPPAFNNPPMTWTLPDQITSSIPPSTAARFLRNEAGQILWFSVPPLDLEEKNMEAIRSVGHSVQYLARRKEIEAKKEQRRVEREKEEAERKRKREEEYGLEQREAKRLLHKALRIMAGTSNEDA
jgi:chromatin structure-remodeling complex subunit RSC1/2